MRLKWIREGIEDYEYVEILKSLGMEDIALNIVNQLAGSGFKGWTESTDDLYSARRTLGEKIHHISTAPPGQNVPPGAPQNLRVVR